jgi:Tol biopolymer transport system component
MKAAVIALAVGTMLTVEQRDASRSNVDPPSAAISADGRFVAFTTYSRLVPADTNDWSDVYVLDRARHDVTMESGDTNGYIGDSRRPAISGDGRYVAFERASAVVLRDRSGGVTRIISDGAQPFITENGRILLFIAGSVDSVTGIDANGERSDIYLLEPGSGHARRVSVDLIGLDPSIAVSVHPSASSDGRYVAFTSRMQADGRLAQAPKVFLRDTELNATRFVGAGWDPSLSGDGRFLAFVGLSNRLSHIFLTDLQTGATRIITNSVRRGLANGASVKPKVSSDGRFVAFQSEASDLVAAEDVNLLWDVFVFDRTTGTMTRVSGDAAEVWMEPSGGPSIDERGSVVAFSSRHPTDASDKRNDFDLFVATDLNTETRRHGASQRIRPLGFGDLFTWRFRSQRLDLMAVHDPIDPGHKYRDMKVN